MLKISRNTFVAATNEIAHLYFYYKFNYDKFNLNIETL